MIGRKLADRYEIQRELGRGGMGSVYLAFDPVLERKVAIKWLTAPPTEALPRQRFLKEARLIAQMNHPHIIQIFDFYPNEDNPFFVMPVLQGKTLRERLQEGPLAFDEARSIGIQVAQALEHSHNHGVIHRDIKPANIFLTPTEQNTHVRVLDFGVALLTKESAGSSGGVSGTLWYLSPEQLTGELVDERSDLYALGSVLYECFAGKPPFQGDLQAMFQKVSDPQPPSLQQMLPALQSNHSKHKDAIGFAAQIMRCLQKDPARRFASAKEFRRTVVAMARTSAELPAPHTPATPTPPNVTPLPSLPTDPNAPMSVGRSATLSKLLANVERSSTGHCHLALVSGPTGIGKTNLAETLSWATQHNITTFQATCAHTTKNPHPFQAFGDILQGFCARFANEPNIINAAFRDLTTPLTELFPDLRLGQEPQKSSMPSPHTSEQLQRLRTGHRGEVVELLALTLQQMSERGPLLLVLEELHASQPTTEALSYMFHRLQRTPIFLFTSHSTDEYLHPALLQLYESVHDNARCSKIRLGPLSNDDQDTLLRLNRPEEIPGNERVWFNQGKAFADGNPGALLSWCHQGNADGKTNPHVEAIPPAALPAQDKKAAAPGVDSFEYYDDDDDEDTGNTAIQSNFTYHQTAPYNAFSVPAHNPWDSVETETLDDLPALLPFQLPNATDTQPLGAFRSETDTPVPSSAPSSTPTSPSLPALPAPQISQTQLPQVAEQLGDLLLIQGKYLAARDAYHTAQRERQRHNNNFSYVKEAYTLRQLALITHSLGQYDETLALCHEGLALVENLAPMTSASLEALCSITSTAAGELAEAKRWLDQGFGRIHPKSASQETLADDLGRAPVEMLLYRAKGNLLMAQSEPGNALKAFHKGLTRCDQAQDDWEHSIAIHNIGEAYLHMGDHSEAIDYFRRSLKEKAALEDQWGIAHTHRGMAQMYLYQQRWSQAHRELERGLPLAVEVGDPKLSAQFHLLWAKYYEENETLDEDREAREAKASLEAAMTEAQRAFAKDEWLQACVALARLYMNAGNLTEAETLARDAQSIGKSFTSPQRNADVHEMWGQLLLRFGKFGDAAQHFELALTIASDLPDPHWQIKHLVAIASGLSHTEHFMKAQELIIQAARHAAATSPPGLATTFTSAQMRYPLRPVTQAELHTLG